MSSTSLPMEHISRYLRVEVYRNLHKGCYSVRALSGEDKGHVIDHVQSITLRDVSFIVQPAGRDRVLEQQRKNVHAFVRGTITDTPVQYGLSVRYDPYLNDAFIVTRPMWSKWYDEIIRKANLAHLSFLDDGHSHIEVSI
jgi:hypothetical protein